MLFTGPRCSSRVARLRRRADGRLADRRAGGEGGGAALLLTAALAVIANRFPDGRERARAWAIWGMCMGIAMAIAPLVGGAITQWIGWRWVFLLNLPVCLLLAAGARVAIDESRDPHAKRVDAAGSLLFGAALACAIAALIGAPSHGWLSAATLGRSRWPPRSSRHSSARSAGRRGR